MDYVPIRLVSQYRVTYQVCACGMQFMGEGDGAAKSEWKAEHHMDRCPACIRQSPEPQQVPK